MEDRVVISIGMLRTLSREDMVGEDSEEGTMFKLRLERHISTGQVGGKEG